MQIQSETFIELPCETATEFLQVLTRTSEHFADAEDNALYRGESDVSRPLLPTAFRPAGMKKLIELNQLETRGVFRQCEDTSKNLGMWFHEKMALAMFYRHANDQA